MVKLYTYNSPDKFIQSSGLGACIICEPVLYRVYLGKHLLDLLYVLPTPITVFAPLLQACGKFINHNLVTQLAKSSTKSPELLARYCDTLLKKSSKNPEEAELEETLNMVVRLTLKYLLFT